MTFRYTSVFGMNLLGSKTIEVISVNNNILLECQRYGYDNSKHFIKV